MRFLLSLLLIGAAASSELFYPAGQEYQFDYEGRIMSGIPALDSHYAGMTIKGRVILQSLDGSRFKLAMKEPKYVNYNARLHSQAPVTNWRSVETPATESAPADYQKILGTPVEFSMQNGEVSQVKISRDEPQWSANFKKALISILKIQMSDRGQQNRSQIQQAIAQGSQTQTWRVMEQDLTGTCEHKYVYSQVQRQSQSEEEQRLLHDKHCQTGKMFQVQKSRNVDRCIQRSALINKQSGQYMCSEGNCPQMWESSATTKYFGCKESDNNFKIQAIVNEGEVQQSLYASKSEITVSGVKQTLRIRNTQGEKTSLPEINNPKTLDELFFEHTRTLSMLGQHSQTPKTFQEQQKILQSEESDPRKQRFAFTLPQGENEVEKALQPETLKSKINEMIESIQQDLLRSENFEKTFVASKSLVLTELMSLLTTDQIESIWQSIESSSQSQEKKDMAKQIFWEASILSGTNPSIMFIIEKAQKDEVSDLQKAEAIISLPHYMRTPTKEIIKELFSFIKSHQMTKTQTMKANSHLAFATILKQVCVQYEKHIKFGEYVFGEFCNAQDSELLTVYIPYFVQQLESAQSEEEKIMAFFPLGNIAHESAVPTLLRYVEGNSDKSNQKVRRMAIYALNAVAIQSRAKLIPVFSAIINNRYEDRYVRIAALTMALTAKPDFTFFQKLATSTWHEEDEEFHKFVFSTLKNLEQIEADNTPAKVELKEMSRYAKSVMPMAKPLPGVISSHINVFIAKWLQNLQVGYQYHGFFTGLLSTKSVYMKLEYFLQRLRFTPLEFAVDTQGLDNLMQELQKDIIYQEPKASSEVSSILEEIDAKPKETTPFLLSVWGRFLNDMNVVGVIGNNEVQHASKWIKRAIADQQVIKQKVCGQTPVNFVKINNAFRYQLVVPSEMGLPIVTEVHMPSVFKLSGQIDVQCDSSIPSMTAELKGKAAGSYIGFVSTYSPFTKEWISAGTDKQLSLNLPTKTKISYQQNSIKISMAQSDSVRSGVSAVDLLHFSVKPFCVIKQTQFVDPKPLNMHHNIKYIRSTEDQKTMQVPLGQALGLDLTLKMKTETDVLDTEAVRQYMKLYNYNPMYMAMLGFSNTGINFNGQPSLKYHDLTLVLDPSTSSTKDVDIELSLAAGAKYKSDKKQVQLQVVQGSQDQKQIKVHLAPIDSSSQQNIKLEKVLEKLQTETGYAFHSDVKVELKGSEQKSFHYTVSAGNGRNSLEQRWNVAIKNERNPSSQYNLCMEGKLHMPNMPYRSLEIKSQDSQFQFYNKAEFGSNCQENEITVSGTNSMSQKAIQMAAESPEGRKCREARKSVEKLSQAIKQARQEKRWREVERLGEEERRSVRKEKLYCKKHRQLVSHLDHLKLEIDYKLNSQKAESKVHYVKNMIEAALFPYLSTVIRQNNQQNKIQVEASYQTSSRTYNMKVMTPERDITYTHVRLPAVLKPLFPLNAKTSLKQKIYKSVTGYDMLPKCSLNHDIVTTFDNKTYAYQLDDCYHLVTSDCNTKTYGILVKEVQGNKHAKLLLNGMTVELKSQVSQGYAKNFELTVNGQQVSINRNERKELSSQNSQVSVHVQRSQDDVVIIKTPFFRLACDGKVVEIEKTDLSMNGQQCGLCGNHDGDKKSDRQTAQKCQAETERAAALTFRVEKSCSSLSEYQQRIKSTDQSCQHLKIKNTPVSHMMHAQSDRCSKARHLIMIRGNQHCISQEQVLECGSGCYPRSQVHKRVGYACLPTDRPSLVQHYEEKVRRGEYLPELMSMEIKFVEERNVPLPCQQPRL
uniref:Vitellogenin 2 n=1 Tax=Pseudodiaptomus annandalei TaxID=298510 RepID=V9P1K5_9MAXI|nr:vitellogenin 2 [Pseudodiaptomus annandalei]